MIKLFNSLGRELQKFKPIKKEQVGIYTCGPTVYHYVTIGNWRTYTTADLIIRTLKYLGYDIKYVMNITDVGHLTGDNEGDASTGEDRMEKAEKREGKTAWEIAEFYTEDFLDAFKQLNLTFPDILAKATDHIQEQIDQIKEIEKKGFTYKTSDGIYFDTQEFEAKGHKYGELSNLDKIKEGARVTVNPEKKDPRDFALWKFSPTDKKRHMEWDSPWGIGFPGWHIECSAMSMKYLGNQFDIHTGGEDLMSTHHPCEIAQAEAITGKIFANYWIHGAFLLVDGGKMGKSLGNAYTLHDIKDRGYSPMHLKYFYLSGNYRKKINFTWESLEAAKNAYERLARNLKDLNSDFSEDAIDEDSKSKFIEAIEDDLNFTKALSILWDVLRSGLEPEVKLSTVLDFDKVFGLNLFEAMSEKEEYSDEVMALIEERNNARESKDWDKADEIRDRLKEEFGVEVQDK